MGCGFGEPEMRFSDPWGTKRSVHKNHTNSTWLDKFPLDLWKTCKHVLLEKEIRSQASMFWFHVSFLGCSIGFEHMNMVFHVESSCNASYCIQVEFRVVMV